MAKYFGQKEKSAVIVFDKLRKLASLDGMIEKSKDLIGKIQDAGYLQPIVVRGEPRPFVGNFTGKRYEPLTPIEIAERYDELDDALDVMAELIPELGDVVESFKASL